jgi:hypothetical protein
MIQLVNEKGNVLFEREQSEEFPYFICVLQEAIELKELALLESG